MTALTFEEWPIDRLIEYARNPRKNDHAVDQMAAAIQEFGFPHSLRRAVRWAPRRWPPAPEGGPQARAETVPVILADDLTPTQIKAFRLLANRSATWAEWDDDLLRLELEELKLDDFDLALTGFDADELLAIKAGEETTTEGQTDDDAVPEVPETPVSRLGDVWICGTHRVLCGDATQEENYQALLGTDHVSMLWQDPPIQRELRQHAKDKMRGKNRAHPERQSGRGVLRLPGGGTHPGAGTLRWRGLHRDVVQRTRHAAVAFRAAGGHWSTFIIWAKNTFTMGRADYQRQYEPMLYGWREGGKRHWCGDRDQGDVWQIKKPVKNDLHPTMKPVELVERAIRNSSRPGDTVLDGFGGSGTTMIAAEKSGRCARLMELDPKYCRCNRAPLAGPQPPAERKPPEQ
jgi:ParB-like chromosome segregation protein Spo0J